MSGVQVGDGQKPAKPHIEVLGDSSHLQFFRENRELLKEIRVLRKKILELELRNNEIRATLYSIKMSTDSGLGLLKD